MNTRSFFSASALALAVFGTGIQANEHQIVDTSAFLTTDRFDVAVVRDGASLPEISKPLDETVDCFYQENSGEPACGETVEQVSRRPASSGRRGISPRPTSTNKPAEETVDCFYEFNRNEPQC